MSPEKRNRRRHKSKEIQYTQELGIIHHIYDEYDRVVWSNPGFPEEHRPNVAIIKPKVSVGDHTKKPSAFQLHPNLKPEIRKISEQVLAQSRDSSAINEVAIHNMDGTQIFSPTLFRLGHAIVWETVAHEAAHSVAQPSHIITPEKYSTNQEKYISIVLQEGFVPGTAPHIEHTHIQKQGFREILRHDKFDISDIGPENCLILNELYPLTMELVCANLMALNGDTEDFDTRLKEGRVMPDVGGSKREFTKFAYAVMRTIGWRQLLNALKLNDLDQANSHLATLEPKYGMGIIATLATMYEKDKSNIEMKNNIDLLIVSLLGNLLT